MKRRASSSESGSRGGGAMQDGVSNIRLKPPHIYDNITRKLMKLGITLAVTTFIGLIVRYAVQEFDPSVNTITVTTSRINNRDIASLSVSKNFLERILEFIEESISIVATIIPLGFPLCTIFNRYFAKIRASPKRFELKDNRILNNMIPKYIIIGDSQACQMPNSIRLRPLIRDTIYHLIKARLKPKLIVEDSYEEARKLGIRIGLISRDHHKLAVIKSVDLLRNITDSRGDIKQGKVRYLLSRMKIMSQSTPADKSLLIYLIKHCESMPNENLAYLGYSFTDPEAMRLADCPMTFQDCDDDDVKKASQLIMRREESTFTDIYLFLVVCLIANNITQSYALFQISASVSSCLYRFLSITVFQEQLLSHSQFTLLLIIQQLFAIFALMTKWLSSLPQAPMKTSAAEMSHAVTEDSYLAEQQLSNHHHHHHRSSSSAGHNNNNNRHRHHRSTASVVSGTNGLETSSSLQRSRDQQQSSLDDQQQHAIRMHPVTLNDDTLGSSSSLNGGGVEDNYRRRDELAEQSTMDDDSSTNEDYLDVEGGGRSTRHHRARRRRRSRADHDDQRNPSTSRHSTPRRHFSTAAANKESDLDKPIHLSGTNLDLAIINSKLATTYKQTFRNSKLIDDVTYRLAKLHIAYQVLVMIIIMVFGNTMFQLNVENNRQHQSLAFNSLFMNNIFSLSSCYNQFGEFNLRSGFKNHPFFVCVLLFAVAIQVCLTELNAFGLENLNPLQWFVCFVFAFLSALIAPLTGQQRSQRAAAAAAASRPTPLANDRHLQPYLKHQQQHIGSNHHDNQYQHHHHHQKRHHQHQKRPSRTPSLTQIES